MKFLFLYKFDPAYHFDKYLHLDLVPHYTKAGYVSKCYGPRVHEAYAEDTIMHYSSHVTLAEIHERFAFDSVVCLTQSRMFGHYRPPLVPPHAQKLSKDCWLPRDFSTFNTMRIMIDEDTHYETENDWYEEANFDIVFNRHKHNNELHNSRFKKLKSIWLPFSVDEELFKPDDRPRVNKLCISASVVHEIYVWRKMLIDQLVPLELMEDFKEQRKVGQNYIDCLRSYVAHGNCSSIYNITPAKMFEIMSSGSVLFTDNTNKYGLKELFYEDSYVTYERDGSDVISKAREIVENKERTVEIANNARQCILDKHTHQIRIKEFTDFIKKI